MTTWDYILVGGGLSNALLAAALATKQPRMRVALVEQGGELGGNHTWCFHSVDVRDDARAFVEPFVAHTWSSHHVRFAGFERTLQEPYAAVTVASLQRAVAWHAEHAGLDLFLNERAARVDPDRVALASGAVLDGRVVVDARGPERFAPHAAIGFQKFVGQELRVRPGTAPREPMLMDACVEQRDGFRFFYVLPFAPDRVLVEDTYFSDTPELDKPRIRAEIAGYAAEQGMTVEGVVREEAGVLPLPARAPARAPEVGAVLHGGYQGGWFHPTTGYSFPLAVRFALAVARDGSEDVWQRVARLARAEARQQRYAALLNRMLFGSFAPEQRHHVLERFYRLPASTVRRFYSLTLTPLDRARILCGRPPRGLSLSRLVTALGTSHVSPRLSGENS